MRYIKKLWNRDLFFYSLLTGVVIVIGQLSIFIHLLQTPKGFYYPYIDRPSPSEYYYMGIIRSGMGPDWLLHLPYVPTPHVGSLIQILFIVLGKLCVITNVGPAEMFALFRIIGGVCLALCAVVFFKKILSKSAARLAFVLFLFVQPIPFLDRTYLIDPREFEDFDHFVWHFGEAARRLSIMPPHYTIGKALALFSLVLLFVYLKNRKKSTAIVAGLTAFVAGLIYPPPVFILFVSLSLWGGCFVLLNLQKKLLAQLLQNMWVFLVPIGFFLSLLLLRGEVTKGYPWNMWNRVELGWNAPWMHFELSYIHMIGLFLLFVPFGIFSWIKKRERHRLGLFLSIWGLSGFFLFPFANFLQVGKFRFTEGVQIVPLSILSLWGIEYAAGLVSSLKKNVSQQVVVKILFLLILVYFSFWGYFSFLWSDNRLKGFFTNVYFRPVEIAALSFMNSIPANSIVLADTFPSNFIPIFARVKTIIGFSDFYPVYLDFTHDQKDITSILQAKSSVEDTKEFLEEHRVNYIYREVDPNQKTSNYYKNLVDKVFDNGRFEIYKMKP